MTNTQKTRESMLVLSSQTVKHGTGRRRCTGCLKSQVSFRKRATNYRALLREMTNKEKASYGSSPPCKLSPAHKSSRRSSARLYLWCTAYCIWSFISPISKLNRISSSLHLFEYLVLYIRISSSLHPRSVEKRPIRLGLENEMKWHSKCVIHSWANNPRTICISHELIWLENDTIWHSKCNRL